ncbi:MAG: ATP-binding protein [bacterium]|nr:ATP-binding protein [bacterium]
MEIKRDYYLDKLIRKRHNGLVKIVTGIRRCGKSYLLDPIYKNYLINDGVEENHIIKLELDSIENEKYCNPHELYDYIMSKVKDDDMYYIILDEVQKCSDFESVLNSFLHKKNLDVYVTGSNSKFLSSDIVTEFRGRGDEIKVYPLSFSEFYSFKNGDKNSAWKEYITYGGLPLVLLQTSDEEKVDYLNIQKNNVYVNDVIERNNIQNEEELKKLVEMISSSVGSLTNPLKLANSFKSYDSTTSISNKTIYNYLKYLEDGFIIEKAERYNIKGKKYIETPQKYYFTDMGIRNSFLNFRQIEENHIMENVIYLELRRRGFTVDVGVVEVRNNSSLLQLEIDFIANKGSEKYYIQSSLNLDTKEKMEQEIRPLINVNDFFKRIIIVKDDIVKYQNEQGIVIMGIYDFLLDSDSLIR